MVAGADGEVSGRPDVKEADANDTDIVLHASAHAHTVPAAVLTSPHACLRQWGPRAPREGSCRMLHAAVHVLRWRGHIFTANLESDLDGVSYAQSQHHRTSTGRSQPASRP